MKIKILLFILMFLSACGGREIVYPYGLNEDEWNSLSVQDQERLQHDFNLYEQGKMAASV